MNTPLMELIEKIDGYISNPSGLLNRDHLDVLKDIRNDATQLLEKEREMIQDAFDEGELNVSDLLKRKYRGSSDYYTKTFTNESK